MRRRPKKDHALTPLDQEIIGALQLDGRISVVDLSRVVNANPRTVRKSIDELIKTSSIEITAVCDPALLGFKAGALIGAKISREWSRSSVAEKLMKISSIDYAATTLGRFDILFEVLCKDNADLGRIVDEELYSCPFLKELQVFPYLSLHYQEPIWGLNYYNNREEPSLMSNQKTIELDQLDLTILRALNEDGRRTFSNLAENLSVSEAQVRKRFNRLIDSKSVKIMAITDPIALGFEAIAWVSINVLPAEPLKSFAESLANLPSVAYVTICAGEYDIVAEVVCRNQSELFDVIENDIRQLRNIDNAEVLLCDDLFYRRVIPA